LITWQEKTQEARTLVDQAKTVFENAEATGEEKTEARGKLDAAMVLKAEAADLKTLQQLAQELGQEVKDGKLPQAGEKFNGFGEYLRAVWKAGNQDYKFEQDPRLGGRWNDNGEPKGAPLAMAGPGSKAGWASESKADMAEAVGATGGFLVPTEFRAELLMSEYERNIVRQRATIIPMRRRQVNIPVLDQTGTTAGQPHQYGGIISTWTEEAEEKDQNDPTFRQIQLTAHKLVCYTRASDELLADSAIGLDAFLRSPMGFAGAINWQEDYTFMRGTGAGQPLGLINAGATISVARAAVAPSLQIDDVINMLAVFQGDNPIWHLSRSQMANLLKLNGPATNPSYVFIPNARDGAPATLFGYPIEWTEKLPAAGTAGDVLLADWRMYLIGDRQQTTIESTSIERWRYDQTSWRAVHRVDGQPWLSAPWTLADGATQISPFVILGDKDT